MGIQDDLIEDLNATTETATIRIEKRRYGKAVTVIRGLTDHPDLQKLATRLKRGLATGGSVKDGTIELQGDHRQGAARLLEAHHIEVDAQP